MEDDPRPDRPADIIHQEMIAERLVLNDHLIKVAELASVCGISNDNVYTIIHKLLGMSKVSAWLVPRNLNMQDRQQRLESSQEFQEVYNANPKTFARDETWLQDWDPDIKRVHAMEGPGLTPPKKFRTQPSAGKVMATPKGLYW